MLTNADIAEEIQRRVDELAMSRHEVLTLLAEHARVDYKDFISVAANGDVALDITKAEGKTHLIKRVTQRRTIRTTKDSQIDETVMSLELHDAQAALVQIGKHHGLFDKRGSEENPVHNVGWSVEEWRSELAKRRDKAAGTLSMFDEDEPGPS